MEERIKRKTVYVEEQQLPEIIRNEMAGLVEFKEKVDALKVKAKEAKILADEMETVKFGKTKSAVEDLQKATKMITDAQFLAVEAQEKSFEYQEKLANTSKYLFGLGVTSIAMNRAVIRELEVTLENGDSVEFDEITHQEIVKIITNLKEQEDIMRKQENMSKKLTVIDEKVSIQEEELIRQEKKDEEHDLLLEINERKDKEQDLELRTQSEKDVEHDYRIEELQRQVNQIIKNMDIINMEKLKYQVYFCVSISLIALVLAVVSLVVY